MRSAVPLPRARSGAFVIAIYQMVDR